MFIMSLAIADLTVGLFVMPISSAYAITGKNLLKMLDFKEFREQEKALALHYLNFFWHPLLLFLVPLMASSQSQTLA